MSSFLGAGGSGAPVGGLTVGVTTISGGTNGKFLFDNSGILGEAGVPALATGNLTFYVATTGSDSNPGTIGSPFATVQHAINVAGLFDYQGLFHWTINIADGTYTITGDIGTITETVNLGGRPHITGNVATPTNVILDSSASGGNGITANCNSAFRISIEGFQINAGANAALQSIRGSIVVNSAMTFGPAGAAVAQQPFALLGGEILLDGQTLTFLWTSTFNLINAAGPGTGFFFPRLSATGVAFIFQPATTFNNTFITALFSYDLIFSGNTYSNTGTMVGGGLVIEFYCVLSTDNGDFNDIPTCGPTVVTPFVDNTCLIQNASSGADAFMSIVLTGQPTTSNTPPGGINMLKDQTNGPRMIAQNDNGTVYVTQIGKHINLQTGASYTLQLFDQEGRVEMNNAGANTLTVPTNASVKFPVGTEVHITQVGAGATSIVGAGGVTIHNSGTLAAQWASVLLYQRAADEWVMTLG